MYKTPGPTTTLLKTLTKLSSNTLYNFTEMPFALYGKTSVLTTPTSLPTTRTRSNKRKSTFLIHKRKKKQDKLLANVSCDHGDAGNTSGQTLGSMWNYLRKFKNNHAKNSLPPEARSNASTDARIWESGPLTLNPLNWHCYRFALGHHLFKHKL